MLKPRRQRHYNLIFLALAACAAALLLVDAAAEAGSELPRYVSLRSDKVNMRVGPGVRYPIAWVYLRKGLPVEVVAEFELWRKVRDREGGEGWVHQSLLSGKRSAIVKGGVQTLFWRAGGEVPVLRAEAGVQGRLLACLKAHCRLRIAGIDGWIERNKIWGVYPSEEFN
jgi:SH3-like domain-containing protein